MGTEASTFANLMLRLSPSPTLTLYRSACSLVDSENMSPPPCSHTEQEHNHLTWFFARVYSLDKSHSSVRQFSLCHTHLDMLSDSSNTASALSPDRCAAGIRSRSARLRTRACPAEELCTFSGDTDTRVPGGRINYVLRRHRQLRAAVRNEKFGE